MLKLRFYYIHKYDVAQQYGGPEEGGWWYDSGVPVGKAIGPIPVEEWAFKLARYLNKREHKRQEAEEDYGYTSVLSYKSNHYSYQVEDFRIGKAYPESRPYYE